MRRWLMNRGLENPDAKMWINLQASYTTHEAEEILWEHIERFKDFIKNVDLNGSKGITHQKKMISDKKIFT